MLVFFTGKITPDIPDDLRYFELTHLFLQIPFLSFKSFYRLPFFSPDGRAQCFFFLKCARCQAHYIYWACASWVRHELLTYFCRISLMSLQIDVRGQNRQTFKILYSLVNIHVFCGHASLCAIRQHPLYIALLALRKALPHLYVLIQLSFLADVLSIDR